MDKNMCVVLLDNFDSFSYNLVDELRSLGLELIIYRNSVGADTIYHKMREKAASKSVLLVLSPGPGAPSDAGCMPELLAQVQGEFPVMGVCLGHQAIVEHLGGKIGRAEQVVHGKASLIQTEASPIFETLPNPLPVARYHSLKAQRVPNSLRIVATFEGIPMAVYNEQYKMLGFQFHPESILTAQGSQLLKQSIRFLSEQGSTQKKDIA